MRNAAALAVLLAGCAAPLREYRGIIHCHTRYSHDSKGTYGEILAAARATSTDFVIITDHPPKEDRNRSLREGWRGLRDGVLFIQGQEYAGSNLLGVGIREYAHGGTVAEKIRSIHAQGGLAIVSHPEEVTDWASYAEADGMEVYNVHAAFKAGMKERGFIVRALKAFKKDPDGAFRLVQRTDPALLSRWARMGRERPFAAVAGNDAHQNINLLGMQLDAYPRAFRFVATHVRAEALTEEAILGALKAGRAYVRFSDGMRLPKDPE